MGRTTIFIALLGGAFLCGLSPIALADAPPCPAYSLNGQECPTITSQSACPQYYMPTSSSTPTGTACAWSGGSCQNLGGSCGPSTTPVSSDVGAAPTTSCGGGSSGWPMFNNGSNMDGEQQICGNAYSSGSLPIGGDITQAWTNFAPNGNVGSNPGQWRWFDGCWYVNDGNVEVTTTGSATINPWSATATNWLTPYAGNSQTRYWSSGALWGTGVEVNSDGRGDWFWVGNQGWSSGLYGPKNPMWTHGCSGTGEMQMSYYDSLNVNNQSFTQSAMVALSSAFSPNANFLSPSEIRSFSSSSGQMEEFRIIEKEITLSSNFAGGHIAALDAKCPSGFILMETSVLSLGTTNSARTVPVRSGISVYGTMAMSGGALKSQVVCRKNGLDKSLKGGSNWGTKRGDLMVEQQNGLFYYGGPGNDKITAIGDSSYVSGGEDDDQIGISGVDSVARGGPGNDSLSAIGNTRIRLEGGPGKDKLVGGVGNTVLDARDGHGGDQISCVGTGNIALIDTGDIVKGSCAQIVRGAGL